MSESLLLSLGTPSVRPCSINRFRLVASIYPAIGFFVDLAGLVITVYRWRRSVVHVQLNCLERACTINVVTSCALSTIYTDEAVRLSHLF